MSDTITIDQPTATPTLETAVTALVPLDREKVETTPALTLEPLKVQLVKIVADAKAIKFDYASKAGQKEARSYVAKLRSSKAVIEAERERLKSFALQYGREVDAAAKPLKDELQQVIDLHIQQVEAEEKKEADRLDAIDRKVTLLRAVRVVPPEASAADIAALIERVDEMAIDESYGERREEAQAAKDESLAALDMYLARARKAEADAKRLADLEAESAARAAADAERLAKEQAVEAERQAAADAEAERKARVQGKIDYLSGFTPLPEFATAFDVSGMIRNLEDYVVDESFGDRVIEAQRLIAGQLENLRAALETLIEAEAKAERDAAIEGMFNSLRNFSVTTGTAAEIQKRMDVLAANDVTDELFGDRTAEATTLKAAILADLDAAREAQADREEAERKRISDAAIEAERKRVADAAEAEAAAEAKRAANKKHLATINGEILADIIAAMKTTDAGIAGDMLSDGHEIVGKAIVEALARGQVRHTTVKY